MVVTSTVYGRAASGRGGEGEDALAGQHIRSRAVRGERDPAHIDELRMTVLTAVRTLTVAHHHAVSAAIAGVVELPLTVGGQTRWRGERAVDALQQRRQLARRAEAVIVELSAKEDINAAALRYANRLSDHLFVMARAANDGGMGDVLWVPGKNR